MAKQPKVKCPKCGVQFYREDCEYVQIGRRYYHAQCVDKEDTALQEIHEKMSKLCGDAYSRSKITNQIKKYIAEGKTLDGILQSLCYWYDYKNSDPSKANGGIGIVGYIYDEAIKYFIDKENRENVNKDVDITEIESKTFVVYPMPITRPKRVRLFDLD